MKMKWIILGALLLTISAASPPIYAQNAITGNLNAATTDCSVTNACLVLAIPIQMGGATINLTGTWSATVQFEVSADPLTVLPTAATWVALSATPSNSTTTATSSTANGAWQVNIAGYKRIRIRVSAYTSGTVAGAINLSTASARGGSGGGGGGGGNPPLNTVTAALGNSTINNGNFQQIWQWQLTGGGTSAMTFADTGAFSGGSLTNGINNQSLVYMAILNGGSTGTPLTVQQNNTTTTAYPLAQFLPVWNNAGLTGMGIIEDATDTASTAGSFLLNLRTNHSQMFTVDKSGNGVFTGSVTGTTGFVATADGVHPGIVSLVGNTTLPTLPANTASIIGSPAATQTSWSLQLPTAIPTTAHLLGCTVTGTNCLLTDEGAVPTGTVTSIATTSPITGGTITATGTIACATCVTSAASLTSTNIMTGAGSQASQTPSSAATLDGSGNMAATSIKVGTSPPTCTIGTAGVLCENEGTAPTGAASVDMVYADSTGHCLTALNNNVNDGCLLSVTNGGTFPITIVSGVSGGIPYFSSTTAESASGILNTNIMVKGGGAGAAPTNSSITDDAKNITSSEVAVLGNKVFVTADFTDSTSTTLQAITGLTWTLPTSKAVNVSFHCALLFDQGTAAVSDSFGIGVTGTAPTQANASGTVFTSASVSQTGTLAALASTTPTAVVTFTPSAITTIWKAELDGTIEQPSNATPGVFNIYVSTTTGTDNIIVKRGSYCSLF